MLRPLLPMRAVARLVGTLTLAALLIGQCAAPALAVGGTNGTINGTVTDQATGEPIAGVSVIALSPSSRAAATTDSKGFFSLNGVPVDTYAVAFQKAGYEPFTLTAVTVQGDQQVSASATLAKSLRVIGRVTSRSASSAYQPTQTTDTYQVSGQQLTTALGKPFAISQTQLQSSVPGIQTTVYGSSSIRGSTRTELAYQFEGVNYVEPLTNQFSNSLGLNGTAALQVNPGAGDATQGNAGAGAINLVLKRGRIPPFGSVDVELVNYPFTHQLGGEYGWATPNGKVSNYTSILTQNQYRTYGNFGTPAAVQGTFFSTDFVVTRDFTNNFIYKWGHDNSRQLQFVYQTRFSDFSINHGGIGTLCYKTCDIGIAGSPTVTGTLSSASFWPQLTQAQRFANFQQIIGLLPGQTDPNQQLPYYGYNHQPVDFFKLEYSQNVNSTLYWTNKLYRNVSATRFDRPYDSTSTVTSRIIGNQGGYINGLEGELIKQFGDAHNTTFSYLYEGRTGTFDYQNDIGAYRSLAGAGGGLGGNGYELVDFLRPGSPCPTTDPAGTALSATGTRTGNPCGYLAQFFGGNTPRIPNLLQVGPGYEQVFGLGIRDQWTVSPKLKLDYGLRYDGANYHFINANNTGLTFPGNAVQPRVWEPRFAAAYQLSRTDALRFSYGRSVQFTPAGINNGPVIIPQAYYNIASRDSRTGLPSQFCGPKFNQQCTSYGQQLHDEYITAFFGPEAFPVRPSTYNNYDASWDHLFKNGIAIKLTPYYKRGYDVNVFSTPVIGVDPTTGGVITGPSILTNAGIDKTTGLEFLATLPDRPFGLSGFLNLTYVNRLQNIPPGFNATEDFYPSAPPVSLALGQLYRAGYLSPLTGRLGLSYRTKAGFRINPIVSYDKGFPQGAGLLAPAFVNGVATVIPNTNGSIPGAGAISPTGAPSGVSQYLDPLNPGTLFKPNVAATRGTAETALTGGVLSRARFNTDLSLEYSYPNTRSTIGVYVTNLFNQIYGEPALGAGTINTRWQPVATGIPGPQTGQLAAAQTLGPGLGFVNWGRERFGQSAWTLVPNNTPINFRIYYTLSL